MGQVTRVFMNGNSQAVRIPQEFRLDAREVHIARNAAGELVITPLPSRRGTALMQALEGMDEAVRAELVQHIEQDRSAATELQEREPL